MGDSPQDQSVLSPFREDTVIISGGNNNNYSYCGPTYQQFWSSWFPHDHVLMANLLLCIWGSFANLVNLVVFSRKRMTSPTNFILAGISLSDLIVMGTFIPFFFCHFPIFRHHFPYFEPLAYVIYTIVIVIFHSMSVWLTMMLAVYRHVAVLYPLHTRAYCTMRRTKISIFFISMVVVILGIPSMISLDIHEQLDLSRSWSCSSEDEVYCPPNSKFVVTQSEFAVAHRTFFQNYKLWYQGIGSRILPCVLLTYLNFRLVKTFLESQKNRKNLIQPQFKPPIQPPPVKKFEQNHQQDKLFDQPDGSMKKKNFCLLKILESHRRECQCHFDKTTKMLIVVLLIFLATEFLPGILVTLLLIFPPQFAKECYPPLRFLCVLLILLSGAFNFPVYMTMSGNFRQTLFHLCGRRQGSPSSTGGGLDNSLQGLEASRERSSGFNMSQSS